MCSFFSTDFLELCAAYARDQDLHMHLSRTESPWDNFRQFERLINFGEESGFHWIRSFISNKIDEQVPLSWSFFARS